MDVNRPCPTKILPSNLMQTLTEISVGRGETGLVSKALGCQSNFVTYHFSAATFFGFADGDRGYYHLTHFGRSFLSADEKTQFALWDFLLKTAWVYVNNDAFTAETQADNTIHDKIGTLRRFAAYFDVNLDEIDSVMTDRIKVMLTEGRKAKAPRVEKAEAVCPDCHITKFANGSCYC